MDNEKQYFFTQNIVTKLSEIWVGDPGSGKSVPVVKNSRIPDTDQQQWPSHFLQIFFVVSLRNCLRKYTNLL
jgi:hypothetical protein